MAKKKTKAEEVTEREETAAVPATAPAAAPTGAAAARPARVLVGSEPKRLSKGQRKHVRRQKQAGEIKVTPRR
jgi:hypothetical protein